MLIRFVQRINDPAKPLTGDWLYEVRNHDYGYTRFINGTWSIDLPIYSRDEFLYFARFILPRGLSLDDIQPHKVV